MRNTVSSTAPVTISPWAEGASFTAAIAMVVVTGLDIDALVAGLEDEDE